MDVGDGTACTGPNRQGGLWHIAAVRSRIEVRAAVPRK